MNMRILFIMGLMLSMTLQLSAQDRRERAKEKIEAKKVAYLSEKLDLTVEEAQVFWPVYNEYKAELKNERKEKRNERKDDITEEEASMKIDQIMQQQQKEIDVKKKYAKKIKNAIGSKKTLMLYKYDRQFKEDMIRQVRRDGRRGNKEKDK